MIDEEAILDVTTKLKQMALVTRWKENREAIIPTKISNRFKMSLDLSITSDLTRLSNQLPLS